MGKSNIPKQLRPQIKRDIHLGHTGVEGCLRRARESVYWPNMNADLKEMVLSCETCRCYEVSQAKEPLMSMRYLKDNGKQLVQTYSV